jgi:hypothetical protein
MSFATLFEKLLEIEKAAVSGDFSAVHALTIEAEELMLQLEREVMDQFEKSQVLRLVA